MVVGLSVNCANCDEEIVRHSLHLSDEGITRIDVSEFSQTTWECPSCGHHTCIGDIDTLDGEEEGFFAPIDDDEDEDDEGEEQS